MAGKTIPMSTVKQMMLLRKEGKSIKEIARITEKSKNTVKSYLSKIDVTGIDVEVLLLMDDFLLDTKLNAGNPSYKEEERYAELKELFKHYQRELKRKGVTKYLLWQEYSESRPMGYSYSQFCHHLSQMNKALKPSAVLDHEPGDKLYVDFAGSTLSYVDRETGEVIQCQVFVACMPYSGQSFAMAVHSQSVSDFIHALNCCILALGGAPKALVPDNLKSAVIKANQYEPTINKALEDLANHYGTTVVPTRVLKPKDKAAVEGAVKIIYNRVYARLRNMAFYSLGELNQAISEKVLLHNQTRMQRKDYCREEKFLADEKQTLIPLPAEKFELKFYKEYKVGPNNHICLTQDSHHYSVPYIHIGKQANVVYTQTKVTIYVGGQKVAAHARSFFKGHYTSVRDHLCSAHKHFKDRSPTYYIEKASRCSNDLHQLFIAIFAQKRYPEQLYRTCDGLLSLQRKHDPEPFAKACQMALEHERYSYMFVSNILKNGTYTSIQINQSPLPKHGNIRGAGSYK